MTEQPHRSSLELQNISKSYGAVKALHNVSCTIAPGEVHAILGENGAGKSTLAAIICGFARPDGGSILFEREADREFPMGNPLKVRDAGIEMVHQHFTLVPELTVEENLGLTQIPALRAVADLEKWSAPALQIAAELGWEFDPKQRVRDLSVGEQQRLEIVRVLGNRPQVIVFDEPTAVLAPAEVAELLQVLSKLREQNKAVVLIAHKLSEVMAIADRVTVLRRGAKVATAVRSEYDAAQLAEWMVGELPDLAESRNIEARPGLFVRNLVVGGDRGNVAISDLSLSVGRGEIVGVGGVDGNGQLELAEALVQIRAIRSGELIWENQPLGPKLEIGYIPQDRRRDGLAVEMSIQDNLFLTGIQRREFSRGGIIKMGKVRNWANHLIEEYGIKADSARSKVNQLSGGNQQKVVASRTLERLPDLLVVCNPSRGLDIRATEFVHGQIRRAREEGTAVLLISSDLDELSLLSDRIVFLSRGKIVEGRTAESLVGGSESGE